MNVLNFALQMGERGKEHYRKIGEESGVPVVKSVFEILGAQRQERCRRLAALQEKDPSVAKTASSVLDRGGDPLKRIFGGTSAGIRNDAAAYRQALAIGMRLVSFLEKVAGEETDREAKALLAAVAEEERRALREIEEIWEFIEGSRWYPAAVEYAIMVDRRGGAFPII